MKSSGGLRYRFCPDCGDMHSVHEWPDNHRRPDEALARPSIISDNQPFIQSMANGEWYDSKSNMRKSYLPSGNPDGVRYTEVGNDPAILRPRKKPKPDRMKVRAAVHGAFSKVGLGA
jgi:hypothetical protein